jgi:hypothetical protein
MPQSATDLLDDIDSPEKAEKDWSDFENKITWLHWWNNIYIFVILGILEHHSWAIGVKEW